MLHGEGMTIAGIEFFGLGGGIPVTPWDWSFDLDDAEAGGDARGLPRGRGAGPPLAAQGALRQRRRRHPLRQPGAAGGDRAEAAAARGLRPHPRVLGLREAKSARRRSATSARPAPGSSSSERGGKRPQARRARPRDADPGRRRRQPQPRRRQRRPAGHRQGLRRRPDDGRPDRGRLLARARRLGPLPRRGRRPLRAQDAAAARHGADRPLRGPRRARTDRRGALPRPRARRRRRRHGLPDDAGADHGALVRAGADQGDRALVGARRRRLGARAAGRRGAAGRVRVGLGLHHQRAAGGDRPLLRLEADPRPRQRDDRAGRPPRRHPLDRDGGDAGAGDQPRARTRQGHDRDRPRDRRPGGGRRLRAAPAPRQDPALRPQDRRPARPSGSPPWPGSSSSAR